MPTTKQKKTKPARKAAPKNTRKTAPKQAAKKARSKTAPAALIITAPPAPLDYQGIKTLAFDIGGSGLKASILDEQGEMLTARVRVDTPQPCPPRVLLEKFKELTAQLPPYDRISAGFPGVVRHGRTLSGVNLDPQGWKGFDLQIALQKLTGKPVIVINDADMQGLGAIKGKGVELVLTLGTGLGSALFEDGRLAPHLELAHIPFRKGETYEEQLGNRAFKEVGKRRWNKRVQMAIDYFRTLTNFDRLYLGGGNAANLSFKLTHDIEVVSNTYGIKGGIWVWKDPNLNDGISKEE
ncbi:MAG: ROK family protein [Acidobacteria bacterium]|nr:ROK family protein [Acidobacteriota bacterium]MBI3427291.1 ROK family protein [Acidobacteriota bacterium]